MLHCHSDEARTVKILQHNMHLGWSMGMTQVQGDQDYGAWTWAVCVDPGLLGHMMDSPYA